MEDLRGEAGTGTVVISGCIGPQVSCVLARPYVVASGSWCAAQVVRAETVALKGPTLPEGPTARTRK